MNDFTVWMYELCVYHQRLIVQSNTISLSIIMFLTEMNLLIINNKNKGPGGLGFATYPRDTKLTEIDTERQKWAR